MKRGREDLQESCKRVCREHLREDVQTLKRGVEDICLRSVRPRLHAPERHRSTATQSTSTGVDEVTQLTAGIEARLANRMDFLVDWISLSLRTEYDALYNDFVSNVRQQRVVF